MVVEQALDALDQRVRRRCSSVFAHVVHERQLRIEAHIRRPSIGPTARGRRAAWRPSRSRAGPGFAGSSGARCDASRSRRRAAPRAIPRAGGRATARRPSSRTSSMPCSMSPIAAPSAGICWAISVRRRKRRAWSRIQPAWKAASWRLSANTSRRGRSERCTIDCARTCTSETDTARTGRAGSR